MREDPTEIMIGYALTFLLMISPSAKSICMLSALVRPHHNIKHGATMHPLFSHTKKGCGRGKC